jgi:uncharacterized DUF497 family protein
MIEISDLDGFKWDESNREKNWFAHQVSVGECEEVFFNLPLLLQSDPFHSQAEDRNYVLGQTNTGRRLFIAFTVRNNKIRVISARDMSKKERVIYAKETA